MKCPKCEEQFSAVSMIPEQQKFTLAFERLDGPLAASVISGMISSIDGLMQEVAKQHQDEVAVFVERIEVNEKGGQIDFFILRKKRDAHGNT